MASDGLMSQVEYADHRGVSKQAIGKMIKSGKIPTTVRNGRKMIDPAAADFALGENRSRVNSEDEDPRDAFGAGFAPGMGPSAGGGGSLGASSASSGLTKARTASEVYRAKISELEYLERVGRLIPVDDARRAMEHCAEMLVRGLDQLPTHADDLATAFSRNGVAGLREALKGVSRDLRQTLSDNMRLTAADDEGGE
ncbi:hypothetical protein [Aurantimonas phage AmM-1]|uniref:terminase small subunit n=1 Tax=Aurantimonas phage AmM-1 TaxID=1503929 RepID=UPI000540D550|nr:terminase small subunit [Aurantimonas phage AmM-1]BAP94458.1 hypothetical protein [Aurantimonas phage AmM-1]